MIALVGGMVAPDYNFNWGIVNEQDETIGAFPRCVIDPTEEGSLADKETNVDSIAGAGNQAYTNEVEKVLLVKGELPSFSSNPLFEARTIMRQALDDLKMLFGRNRCLNGACDSIMYTGSQIENLKRNDTQRPLQLRVRVKIVYSQDRSNPTQYASA